MSINVQVTQPENVSLSITTGNSISVSVGSDFLTQAEADALYLTEAEADALYIPLSSLNTLAVNDQLVSNVPALRVNNFYTTEGYINIYKISTGELFGGWGIIDDIDVKYPIWQSIADDTSRCLLYTNSDGMEILQAPFLNNAIPITGSPQEDFTIPVWEKIWSGQGYSYNNVEIDLIDKYQLNSISELPPTNPTAGDSWFNKQNGKTYLYYVNSGDILGQWIQI